MDSSFCWLLKALVCQDVFPSLSIEYNCFSGIVCNMPPPIYTPFCLTDKITVEITARLGLVL